MDEYVKKAIKLLTEKVAQTENLKADDALKYTQAALNLAHVAQVVKDVEMRKV